MDGDLRNGWALVNILLPLVLCAIRYVMKTIRMSVYRSEPHAVD
jgi:hypothetical protein